MTPRLHEKYKNEIIPSLMERFSFKNIYQVPRLTKIVVNVGMGEASQDKTIIDSVLEEMAQITGQRPAVTKSKKAIAVFKIRKGSVVGQRHQRHSVRTV